MHDFARSAARLEESLTSNRSALEVAALSLTRSADTLERLLKAVEGGGVAKSADLAAIGAREDLRIRAALQSAGPASLPAIESRLREGFGQLAATAERDRKELLAGLSSLLSGAAPTVEEILGRDWRAAPQQAEPRAASLEAVTPLLDRLGDLLGGLELGGLGGRLVAGLEGRGDGASGLGASLGAVAGSLVPGVGTALGSLAGGLLGSLAGSLFGRSEAPAVAAAHLTSGPHGIEVDRTFGRNGGDEQAARHAAETFGVQLEAMLRLAGARLGGGLNLAVGHDEERGFFVEGPGFGGSSTRSVTRRTGGREGDGETYSETVRLDRKFFGANEGAALDFAFRQGIAQAAEELDASMRAVIERSLDLREDVGAVLEDVAFARDFDLALEGLKQGSLDLAGTIGGQVRAEVERTAEALRNFVARSAELGLATDQAESGARQAIEAILGLGEASGPQGAFAEAMERTRRLFAEMAPLAEEFGISSARLAAGLQEAVAELEAGRDKAAAAFSTNLEERLLRAGGQEEAATLLAFDARAEQELEAGRANLLDMGATAATTAGLMAKLEATLAAERLAVIRGFGERARQAFEQATRGVGEWLERQILGPLSTLSPLEKLAEAERRFEELLHTAKGGDAEAARGLAQTADRLLTIADAVLGATPDFAALQGQVVGAIESFLAENAEAPASDPAATSLGAVPQEPAFQIALESRLLDPARPAVAQLQSTVATAEQGLRAPVVDIALARVVEALRQQTVELARALEDIESAVEGVKRELRDGRTLTRLGAGAAL